MHVSFLRERKKHDLLEILSVAIRSPRSRMIMYASELDLVPEGTSIAGPRDPENQLIACVSFEVNMMCRSKLFFWAPIRWLIGRPVAHYVRRCTVPISYGATDEFARGT